VALKLSVQLETYMEDDRVHVGCYPVIDRYTIVCTRLRSIPTTYDHRSFIAFSSK
jgi:hypothetical protein